MYTRQMTVLWYLEYSDVNLIICKASGFVHFGNFSSATLNGTASPVSRFFTITCSKISFKTQHRCSLFPWSKHSNLSLSPHQRPSLIPRHQLEGQTTTFTLVVIVKLLLKVFCHTQKYYTKAQKGCGQNIKICYLPLPSGWCKSNFGNCR